MYRTYGKDILAHRNNAYLTPVGVCHFLKFHRIHIVLNEYRNKKMIFTVDPF